MCASLHFRTRNMNQYVHSYMSVNTYRQLYAPSIGPLFDKSLWPKNPRIVNPAKCTRPPGRPRYQRRRDRDEGGSNRKYMCEKCYVYGHNRTTCKGASAEDQAPATFTRPHVRPNPEFRPTPPPSTPIVPPTEAAQPPSKRKRKATQPPTNVASPTQATKRGGRGNRGGRESRSGRGGRTSSNAPPAQSSILIVPPAPTSIHSASPAQSTNDNASVDQLTTSNAPADPTSARGGRGSTIAFGRSVSTGLRGRGSRGLAKGKTVHRKRGEIMGVGIMLVEDPTLPREPVHVQMPSAQF